MTEKGETWSILITLIILLASAYLLAWRGKRLTLRRAASLLVAITSGLVAYVGTMAYAIPAVNDLHNRAVPLIKAVIGNLMIWAICLGAWFITIKFAVLTLRKNRAR